MQSKYPVLDELMAEQNIKYPELGKAIGMDEMAVYRRLRGITEWKLPEVLAVCRYFNNPNATYVFTIR